MLTLPTTDNNCQIAIALDMICAAVAVKCNKQLHQRHLINAFNLQLICLLLHGSSQNAWGEFSSPI
jgi:hypothetical protein